MTEHRPSLRTRLARAVPADAVDELTRPEHGVEPADGRTRDLGLPDGFWWGASVVVTLALIGGLVVYAAPAVGDVVAQALAMSVSGAFWVFAWRRWGHRRYSLRRAAAHAAWVAFPLFFLALVVHSVISRVAPGP